MTLVYLYAIAPERAAAWLGGHEVRGIAGRPVRAVAARGVAGAVSDVPAAEFDQEPLDRNVADASWLAPHAAAHQEVNAALLEGVGAVIPLSFGTLFRSEHRVREVLAERGADLASALAAVDGKVEWVFTLDRDRDAALAALEREGGLAGQAAEARDAAPGRRYLLERKLGDARKTELRRSDAEAAGALRDALAGVAEEITDEPLIEGGPIARVTALVARDGEAPLRAALDRFERAWSARGCSLRISGPWPPYRYGARLGSLRE